MPGDLLVASASAQELVELVRKLVSLRSVNPDVAPTDDRSITGESRIAEYCSSWLADRGFEVTVLESVSGRPSIVAVAAGTGGGRSLMLNGHLDTVGVSSYQGEPFDTVLDGGRIYGRGTFDMKAGLAAMMVAAARCVAPAVAGDVVLALAADEEFGSIGTAEIIAHRRTDAAIVVEPSELELTVAHRGFAWFDIEITGKAAHGSQPELGIDAIAAAGRVLHSLERMADGMSSQPAHPLLGHGSVRVATINGGIDAATVADTCRLTIERRFLPGETVEFVEDQLREVVQRAVTLPGTTQLHGTIRLPGTAPSPDERDRKSAAPEVTLSRLVGRSAFEAEHTSDIVTTVARASRSVLGREPAQRGEPFWTDAGLFSEAGIPCLVFGVDGRGAHADVEWATVSSIVHLTNILEATIRDFCGVEHLAP
ncbi:MAG: acetylornithine deacetylase [Glaciihabitans sp.]|nr:acetylornithine deacetylase [Glaciihabitans sp.]